MLSIVPVSLSLWVVVCVGKKLRIVFILYNEVSSVFFFTWRAVATINRGTAAGVLRRRLRGDFISGLLDRIESDQLETSSCKTSPTLFFPISQSGHAWFTYTQMCIWKCVWEKRLSFSIFLPSTRKNCSYGRGGGVFCSLIIHLLLLGPVIYSLYTFLAPWFPD